MHNVPFRATGEAMPVAFTFPLPKCGIVLTIAMRAGKPVMYGRREGIVMTSMSLTPRQQVERLLADLQVALIALNEGAIRGI